jgi:hypothetical protein
LGCANTSAIVQLRAKTARDAIAEQINAGTELRVREAESFNRRECGDNFIGGRIDPIFIE